ncbi:UNVERIFIED_CONTAM: hypothetical protein GTU68_024654, partial [Idotea baltica]|nr:hypothetical protein [Idotea baltica]
LIFATQNQNKLAEIKDILRESYEVIGLHDLKWITEIDEPYATLEENAVHKAQTVYDELGIPCFAEDTGLEVTALDMKPGVYTARYAGPDKNDLNNMRLLLKNLHNKSDRSAQFRSVMAIYDGTAVVIQGILKGQIATEPSGDHGFGYDPIFIPEGYDKTMAQLAPDVKNQISHRAR